MELAASDASPMSNLLSGMSPMPRTDPSDQTQPLDTQPVRRGSSAPGIDFTRTDARTEIAAPVASSYLNRLSLYGISQMLNLESKSCLLEATNSGLRGTLVFINGNVVDAEIGEIRGDRAVELMLAWQHPTVWIHESNATACVTVTKPITQLLLESLRKWDETTFAQSAIVLPSDPTSTVSLVADADARLAAMARARGVIAVAVIDSQTKTVLGHAAAADEFDAERMATEVADAAAFQLLANGAIDEIRMSGKESLSLILPLDLTQGVYFYIGLKTNLANPTRTVRRMSKLATALLADESTLPEPTPE